MKIVDISSRDLRCDWEVPREKFLLERASREV